MKALLITGGYGFIASNFINRFLEKNPDQVLINLDNMYYCANETNVDRRWRESSNYHFIKGNICSIDLVNHILNSYKVNLMLYTLLHSHTFKTHLQTLLTTICEI